MSSEDQTRLPGSVPEGSGLSNDEKIIEALKQNWSHARHVEDLRLRLATFYIVAMLGAGLAALGHQNPDIKLLGFVIGFVVTLLCWGMTHKWNIEFSNQIRKADVCARTLIVKSQTEEQLHKYLGFPIRDACLPSLNVRLMFHFLYGAIFLTWVAAWWFVK